MALYLLRLLLLSLHLLCLLHFLHKQNLLLPCQLLLIILRLAIGRQNAPTPLLLLLLLRVMLTVLVVVHLLFLGGRWRALLHRGLVLRRLRLRNVLQRRLRGLQEQVLLALGVELHLSPAH